MFLKLGQAGGAWPGSREAIEMVGVGVAGTLLVIDILPCPKCGTPLALHIWPLLPLFVTIRNGTPLLGARWKNGDKILPFC